MRIGFLSVFIIFCLYLAAGQPEAGEGTCSAQDGGTCGSDSNKVCFPDGSCFGSLAEAVSHYQGSTGVIPMQVPEMYGEAQLVDAQDPATYENTLEHLAKTHQYMTNLYRNETAKAFRDECKLTHESCTFWASIGECEAVSTVVLEIGLLFRVIVLLSDPFLHVRLFFQIYYSRTQST